GDFARLRNVRLGYSLPRPVLSRLKMQNLTVFVSGDNLLTLTRFTGIDPEENGSFGEENAGKYPFARKYLAGLQLSF
ncbi:hypothetical protein BWI97_26460, partial [Siphonobacter sp. BAB-5405]|uniref:hypothetical protein n=1 Tax=Siphonobacter sp. BAB-5405 TaxID=1864825 RepID=UPI000CBA4FA5